MSLSAIHRTTVNGIPKESAITITCNTNEPIVVGDESGINVYTYLKHMKANAKTMICFSKLVKIVEFS